MFGGDQQWPGAQDTSRWTRTQGRIVGDNTKHELEPWQHKESAGLAKHTLISTFLTLFHYVIFSFFFKRAGPCCSMWEHNVCHLDNFAAWLVFIPRRRT